MHAHACGQAVLTAACHKAGQLGHQHILLLSCRQVRLPGAAGACGCWERLSPGELHRFIKGHFTCTALAGLAVGNMGVMYSTSVMGTGC